jgi:hypothetical protein
VEAVLWPVGGGQLTGPNMLRRFEVTGTNQGEQQVICRPRIWHAMHSIDTSRR